MEHIGTIIEDLEDKLELTSFILDAIPPDQFKIEIEHFGKVPYSEYDEWVDGLKLRYPVLANEYCQVNKFNFCN